jgi:dolichyl-phosphate-mannose-protein mannosyltransferase
VSAEYNRGVPPASPSPGFDSGVAARPAWARGLLPAILVVALLLRVVGIAYGLPDWIYHSDTTKQLLRVVPFMRGDLVPEDTYPVLHMYLAAALFRIWALIDPHGPAGAPSWPQLVVTVRLINALLGTATVGLLALAARRLFGWRVGLLAAGLLALSPVSIVHAHYEMGDVPQAFFVVAALGAAATALMTGGAASVLLTGVLAGFAASAKFFGVVVLTTALVAVVGARRHSPVRALALLAGAGILTVITFVLSTPLLLLEPHRFLAQVRESPEMFLGVTLGPLERLWVGSRVLLGLALDWFGVVFGLVALCGTVILARRGWPGTLVLTTPAIVIAIYVWFRPHGLDDRYLVILAPFAAVSAAMTVAWLARRSRPAALTAAVALLAVVTVDALHVTYLFWTDDTREHALRWRRRYVPPGTRVVGLSEFARGDLRERGSVLVTDTQSDDRLHVWYSAQRSQPEIQVLARLAREGKLLRQFEWLPRGFMSPTISYYDLESMGVPYAFPPPDDVTSDEDVVFLDPGAVPDRAAVVVMPGAPRTWTLVSRTSMSRITLALSGDGRIRAHWGFHSRGWTVDAKRPTLVELAVPRGFPWFTHVYRLRLEPGEGRVAVRLLRTPCDVAEQRLALEEWTAAIRDLDACRGTRWMEPVRLLNLAWAHVRAGQSAGARAALAELERAAPALLDGLIALVARPDGEAWRQQWATLVGRGRFTWYGHTFRHQAEESPARIGTVVDDDTAGGGRFLRAAAGATPAGVLKIWMPEHFLRGRYRATFRLRGTRLGVGPIARLEIVRSLSGGGADVVATRDWTPGPGAGPWDEVVVPFATDREPVDLELQIHYLGRGTLDMDEVTVVPDVRTILAERLAALAPLRGAGGSVPPR